MNSRLRWMSAAVGMGVMLSLACSGDLNRTGQLRTAREVGTSSGYGESITRVTRGEVNGLQEMTSGGDVDPDESEDQLGPETADGIGMMLVNDMSVGAYVDTGGTTVFDVDDIEGLCGDRVIHVNAGEECDDGNTVNELCAYGLISCTICDDSCSLAAGKTSYCGDGVIDAGAGEACDTGAESAWCDEDCTEPECGDGVLNTMIGETCDTAGESSWCDVDCTDAICGDATLNTSAGEACDDGNNRNGDGCNVRCQRE